MFCKFELVSENLHRCVYCGTQVNSKNSSDKVFSRCVSDVDRAINLAKAVASHVIDGGVNVSDEEQKRRISICEGTETEPRCEFYDGTNCRKCGCHMNLKSRWRSSSCPIGRW